MSKKKEKTLFFFIQIKREFFTNLISFSFPTGLARPPEEKKNNITYRYYFHPFRLNHACQFDVGGPPVDAFVVDVEPEDVCGCFPAVWG
jgi:hypothetical protein